MYGSRAYLATIALCLLFIIWAFQIYDRGDLYESLPVPMVPRLPITPRTFEKNQHRDLGIPTKKTPVNKILLMTYMRSGSSFVGELLRFGGDVFYVFEPFWLVYEKTFRTDTEICHRNGTCLRPIKTLQKTNKTLDIINAIFDCRISDLPKEVLKSFTKFHFTSGYSKRCKSILTKRPSWKSRRGGIKQYDNKKEWCLARWERACQEASARVIKTIRLSPRVLETMYLPDVKVVHLTRHPLGILNSRMNIGEVNTTNMLAHARHLCQMMEQDIHYVNNKKVEHIKEPIAPVTFECLVSNPVSVTKKLFHSLNLNYSLQTENWIVEHTHDVIKIPNAHNESRRQETGTSDHTRGTFHIRKTSSKDVASAWRRNLPKDLIQLVEGVCEGVIDVIASEESSNDKSACL